ncbi:MULTISPECIES: restriction endonuclease subunit S [unclassified Shewanella]|uniref:restriction endonuclease subunit S n=1 Tax=Shewanella TaxID=22 RepID=UPI0021D9943C|nr:MULTISPECIES: restriction endonuclease subunit S [unclassified Shewanella]MCU8044229.1 restriction endonuclease subunit S [Shewanella sp. SM68]MCU8048311.1 restriction endonuclease subunit S [Shewanella sp. SM65]
MRSNYKKLGQFIRVVDSRNKENRKDNLLGVSTQKVFIDSVANTVGTDFKKYKIVRKHQFTYVPDTSRRGDKIGIAMLESLDQALVSQAYTVFEVIDSNLLDPEYLMLWFRRPEFDRYARFKSHGSVREIFDWQEMCDVELPVPSIEEQREIVREYNVVNDRIALNEQLTQKLEDTAQAIYKQWFVDFEFPISKEYAESIGKPELEGKPYKSSGGELVMSGDSEIPTGWEHYRLEQLVDRVCVGFVGTLHSSYCREGEGVRLLRTTDLTDQGMSYFDNKFVLPDFHKKNKKSQLKYGDVLVARHGSNGMPVIFDRNEEANCLNVIIVKPETSRMSSKVVQVFMKSDSAVEQVRGSLRGSVQSVLNTKIVAALSLSYFSETTKNYVDTSIFSTIQENIQTFRQEAELLKKMENTLLTKISKA